MQDSIFGMFGKSKADPTELALIAQVISSEQMKEVEEEDVETIIEGHMVDIMDHIDALEDRLTNYMDESMQSLAMLILTRSQD